MSKNLNAVAMVLLGGVCFSQEDTEKKKKIEKKVNVILNVQSSIESNSTNVEDEGIAFKTNHFRLELKGEVTDKIFYRFRTRLNKKLDASSLDNLSKATDMAYVGYKFNNKYSLILGKFSQYWGGFEYDFNPVDIYEYSEFINGMDIFMLGASFFYQVDEKNELLFNITNSRNDKFEDIYGENTGIESSKIPLTYILGWNTNLLDGKVQARTSVGYQQEAKNYGGMMMTTGVKFNLPKIQVYVDYLTSMEGLDRLKYAEVINNRDNKVLKDVVYHTLSSKIEYQPTKKWNVFLQGSYETTKVGKLPINTIDTRKKIISYLTGIEYAPFPTQDLKFFFTYSGKSYHHRFEELNSYKNRFMLGMIYRLKVY